MADYPEKRRILELIGLNWTLQGRKLMVTMRKPFDLLAEGLLLQNGRGGRTWSFVNETPGQRLVLGLLPQAITFEGDEILQLVAPGLYSKRRQRVLASTT